MVANDGIIITSGSIQHSVRSELLHPLPTQLRLFRFSFGLVQHFSLKEWVELTYSHASAPRTISYHVFFVWVPADKWIKFRVAGIGATRGSSWVVTLTAHPRNSCTSRCVKKIGNPGKKSNYANTISIKGFAFHEPSGTITAFYTLRRGQQLGQTETLIV